MNAGEATTAFPWEAYFNVISFKKNETVHITQSSKILKLTPTVVHWFMRLT